MITTWYGILKSIITHEVFLEIFKALVPYLFVAVGSNYYCLRLPVRSLEKSNNFAVEDIEATEIEKLLLIPF
jgi:hypothetical protein